MATIHKFTFRGITDDKYGWANRLGLTPDSFYARIRRYHAGELSEKEVFTSGFIHRRDAKLYTYEGKKYTVKGLARRLGVNQNTLYGRLYAFAKGKISKEELFSRSHLKPHYPDRKKRFLVEGQKVSARDLAKKYDVSRHTVERLLNTEGLEKTLEFLKDPYRRYRGFVFVDGVKRPIDDVVAELGILRSSLHTRYCKGWSAKRAIEQPRITMQESLDKAYESKKSATRRRELLKMGVVT